MLALDERDRLGLSDALPIFSRFRSGGASDKAPRPMRRRVDAAAELPPRKRRGRPSKSVRARARALLREQLADGPRHGEHVIAAAAEADISERNLIAAAERLGVRSQRGQWWLP
jgi:hypothetical protein